MAHVKKKAAAPPRRRRLSSEEAREAILAATEKRLREIGPDALRLQDIANDVGLSHPTVLHHVGNREALVSAVVARSMLKLETDLIACFTPGVGPAELITTLHQVDDVMRVRGQARLVAWLALTQPAGTNKKDSRLADVAAALHAARTMLGKENPTFEDTAFGVVLAATAMFGLALLGPQLLMMVGLGGDEATLHRFREQLAGLLLEHAGIPVPDATPPRRRTR
jgi:AcrR family transcriptional regulator